MRITPLAAIVLVTASPVLAQAPTPAATSVPSSTSGAAAPADVASIESIVAAVYDVISGPAAKKRDWARFRSLFAEGARMIPTGARPGGTVGARVLDVDGYIERSSPFFEKEGFYEREVARRVERFGHIAHVFSTYEARHDPSGPAFIRGINSFQLMNDGHRWWVVTIFWEAESDAVKIPAEFLK